MPDTILTRIRNAWNVFRYGERTYQYQDLGVGYGYRPDRIQMLLTSERQMIASVYNRIGIDAAAININHVRLDLNNKFIDIIDSSLNNCLNVEANIDQTGRAFIQDVVMSMCDEGSVAIVPVDTTVSPRVSGSYEILTMRTGRIIQWWPEHVEVEVYNRKTGQKENIVVSKTEVAIVENPLYAVMNQPNSTLQRLIDKINLLDVIDTQSGSGKLDLIMQLPYVIKTPARQKQAENRRDAIEDQLMNSRYGIAYIDGTEKITQLNRPAENNLMEQIEYLTSMLWSQLGLTKEIFEGTADEPTMINYYNRTIEPILSAICGSMIKTFLTRTARSQGQSIIPIRNPFRLVTTDQLAEISDKFTRNEILSPNDIRAIIGLKPSSDPKADELRNRNISQSSEEAEVPEEEKSEINSKWKETKKNGKVKA